MLTNSRHYLCLFGAMSLLASLAPVAFAQTVGAGTRSEHGGDVQLLPNANDQLNVTPVNFPGALAPRAMAPGTPATVPQPGAAGSSLPAPALPTAGKPEHQKLTISQMNGEVHFKHLQGPSIDPGRALYIETGAGNSWCECKLQDCSSRVWCDSEVSIFPETGVLYLKKGALVIKVNRGTESTYTVIAGDLMCRVQATTLRVQRNDRVVNFQVSDGTITVYNRQTGEVYRAGQVTQPVR
jgi:hypothetical protein